MWKIYINDSQDLDFVLTCLFCGVINLRELNLWAEEVVRTTELDIIPEYVFDLVYFDDSLLRLDDVIGFVPCGDLSDKDINALYGIAFARGVDVYDSPVTKKDALEALRKNPKILEKFKRFFPFVELPVISIES